jgi:hypothetical protein
MAHACKMVAHDALLQHYCRRMARSRGRLSCGKAYSWSPRSVLGPWSPGLSLNLPPVIDWADSQISDCRPRYSTT